MGDKTCFILIREKAGFTLVELLVVMVVFVTVIIIASDSFKTILTRTTLLSRSAESNIEGVVGLEMFRHDLNQAGYGLPWGSNRNSFPAYDEAVDEPASDYNDGDGFTVNLLPRAIVAGDDLISGVLSGTDYLVLRGATLARNRTSQRWTYVNYSSTGMAPKTWPSGNLTTDDYVIVLRRTFTETGYRNLLVHSADGTFSQQFTTDKLNEDFQPTVPGETYFIYGISNETDSDDSHAPRMPFNRTDYYVKTPLSGQPASCAPKTGTLYKATLNHSDGKLNPVPLIDCVADMQIVYGWDLNDDGAVDVRSSADGGDVNPGDSTTRDEVQKTIADPELLRSRLKYVNVYLLVQDGKKELNYVNKRRIIVGNADGGEISLTKKYEVSELDSNGWLNYRWKLYRMLVNPQNLSFN